MDVIFWLGWVKSTVCGSGGRWCTIWQRWQSLHIWLAFSTCWTEYKVVMIVFYSLVPAVKIIHSWNLTQITSGKKWNRLKLKSPQGRNGTDWREDIDYWERRAGCVEIWTDTVWREMDVIPVRRTKQLCNLLFTFC